jgi:transcriptional regulator NrdR family protein
MKCPQCNSVYKTVDTRAFRDPERRFNFVERKRVCRECNIAIKTIEIPTDVWEKVEYKDAK